jgi:hypothetical protein
MKSGRAGAGEQSGSEQSAEEQSENGAFDASWRFLQGGNFPGGIDSSTAAESGVASPEAPLRIRVARQSRNYEASARRRLLPSASQRQARLHQTKAPQPAPDLRTRQRLGGRLPAQVGRRAAPSTPQGTLHAAWRGEALPAEPKPWRRLVVSQYLAAGADGAAPSRDLWAKLAPPRGWSGAAGTLKLELLAWAEAYFARVRLGTRRALCGRWEAPPP